MSAKPFLSRVPTEDEQRRFLISYLFAGSLDPGLAECVARAYRDFSRTAHGITKGETGLAVKLSAHRLVETLVSEAIAPRATWTPISFDHWHESACKQIQSHYAERGYSRLTVGHAQKWLNMSIKYALSLAAVGMLRLANPDDLRAVAHVPLDEFFLTSLKPYEAPSLPSTWSNISDYHVYIGLQEWVRLHFGDSKPIDVEFRLYNEEAASRRQHASVT